MRFLLQMAGLPGSGKSTLARNVAKATGAVVIDKDVIKSRMPDDGLGENVAAPLAYAVFFEIGASLLSQDRSVILDSPAFFTDITPRGQQIACEHGVPYFVIECVCPDEAEMKDRLTGRIPRPSQMSELVSDPYAGPGRGPLRVEHASIDTTQPEDDCLLQSLEYLVATARS